MRIHESIFRSLMRTALFAVLLALPARARDVGRLSSRDGLVLVFRVSPITNLVYQLNCLAGIGTCTREVFRAFWEKQAWSPDDEAALESWGKLMRRYERQVELEESASPPGPIPRVAKQVDLLKSLRVTALRADSWEAYGDSLSILMTPEDARQARELAGRFQARFERWWLAEGRGRAQGSARGVRNLCSRKGLPEFYAKVAHFYGYAYPPGTKVAFNFVAQPGKGNGHSNGEQLDRDSVVEVTSREAPEDRIDVVSHELFHYFYHAAPRSTREALIAAFDAAPEPYAFAAYGLLNEAVATALGQGLVSRRVMSPEAFAAMLAEQGRLYADPIVNDSAKALIEPIEGFLAGGVTIGQPEFARGYLDAVHAGLGERLSSPRAWFRTMALAYDQALEAGKARFTKAMRPNSAWTYTLDERGSTELFDRHGGLSGALFVKPSNEAGLRAWSQILGRRQVDEILALAKKRAAFVYGAKRYDKAYIYVFVAPGGEAAEKLVEDFAKAPTMFAGLLN